MKFQCSTPGCSDGDVLTMWRGFLFCFDCLVSTHEWEYRNPCPDARTAWEERLLKHLEEGVEQEQLKSVLEQSERERKESQVSGG